MRVVLDTNILLQSIAHNSRLRPMWAAYLNESFDLIVTTSILLEYDEKIAEKTSVSVAHNVVSLIGEAVNSVFVNVYYEWNTNDAHFNEAKSISFPKVNIITADKFLDVLKSI